MATITTNSVMTLAQAQKAEGPDGKLQKLYDTLRRRTTIMEDMPFAKANFPDKHRITLRDGTGNPSFVNVNDFANVSTINSRQVDEYIGILEDYSQTDDRWEEVYPDILSYRDQVDRLKIGDMTAFFASHVFYGSRAANPKAFDGLATRSKKLNDPFASTYDPTLPICLTGGGSANRTSLYVVQWGEDYASGIYAPGSSYGVDAKDLGRLPIYNQTGQGAGIMMAYTTRIRFSGGLAVKDPRSIARIANIDYTAADPWTSGSLQDKLNAVRSAMNPTSELVIYAHPALFSKTQTFLQNKANIIFDKDEFGRPQFNWMGFKWRIAEQIVTNESACA